MKRSFPFLVLISLFMAACTSLQQKAQSQFEAGEYQLAISSFSKILEENPDDQQANLMVAESYRLSNRLEKAAPYYDKVLEKEASFDNYFKKCTTFIGQVNYEKATNDYTTSKKLTLTNSIMDLADKLIAYIRIIKNITEYFSHHVLENYTSINTLGIV